MANEITITVKALTGEAVKGLQNLNSELKGVQKSQAGFKTFAANARKVGLGLSAFAATGILLGKQFVSAAMEQAQAEKVLAQAVKNSGGDWEKYRSKVNEVTSALQLKTNYGDEEQMLALNRMVPVLGNTEKALDALPSALDLATNQEMDLGSASQMLAKFLTGQTDTLGRTGIEVKKGTGYLARLHLVQKKLGGQAEANANQFTILGNAVGELKETIGFALLPTLIPLVRGLTKLMAVIQKIPKPILKVGAVVGLAAVAFAAIVGPILLFVGMLPIMAAGAVLLAGALFPIAAIVVGITAALIAGYLIWKNWGNIVKWLKDQLAELKAEARGVIDLLNNLPGVNLPGGTPEGQKPASPLGLLEKVNTLAQGPQGLANQALGFGMKNTVGRIPGVGTALDWAGTLTSPVGLAKKVIGAFASGGVVPGPIGAPQLAMVHGGETISPRGGGVNINIGTLSVTGGGSDIDMRRQARAFLDIVREELRTRTANRSLA